LELATPHLKDASAADKVIESWSVYKEGSSTEWLDAQIQDLGAGHTNSSPVMSTLRRPRAHFFLPEAVATEDFERRLNDLRAWC